MKIVIDIPKNLYTWIKDSYSVTLGDKWMNTLTSAIRKSTIYEEPSNREPCPYGYVFHNANGTSVIVRCDKCGEAFPINTNSK